MLRTAHRFNVGEYYRMAETGVLSPDSRVELLDGEIHDMSPIGLLHGGVVNRLNRLFTLAAKGRWIVSTQNPVWLDDFSEPQPDLMLLRPSPDDYTRHHPAPDDVLLLIEAADCSLAGDRGRKLPLYARAAIPEVWIVNLHLRAIEVCRQPTGSAYVFHAIVSCGDNVRPDAFADAVLDLAELFR